MGCIKFIVKQGNLTFQIKIDDEKGLYILDDKGEEVKMDSLLKEGIITEKFFYKFPESLPYLNINIRNISNKFEDKRLFYNFFFNVLKSKLQSKQIQKEEDSDGNVTYIINSSSENKPDKVLENTFDDISNVFNNILSNLTDINNVDQDILSHYSVSYRAKVLGHSDAEIIDNPEQREADILYSLNEVERKIYDLTPDDFNKVEQVANTVLKTVQQDFNRSLNDFIRRFDELAKAGGLFDAQLYSQLFNMNEDLNYIETLKVLEANYRTFVEAFNKYVSRPYDILRNREVELPDIETKEVEDKKEKKKPTIENVVANLYLAVEKISDENAEFYQQSIEKLFDVFDSLAIKNLIKSLHALHEHIKLIENLHGLIKSNREEITKYLSTLGNKELSYVEETRLYIKTLEDAILGNKKDNKSLEILNSLSKLYVDIISLRTNYEYFKKNKLTEKNDRDIDEVKFTANELKKIIELSDTSNIDKDITWYNKFLIQFENTNIAEVTSLKTLFSLHDIRLKDRNKKDLDNIKEKYNHFLDRFGSYEAMEQAMNSLFERDKTKSVRTGYLISKYDNKKLVEVDDAFRTSNMNGDLYELYKFIRDNTTYGSLIEQIDIVPSIFDLLGFEYVKSTGAVDNFTKRDSVYNDVVLQYSMIRTTGNANTVIGKNYFNNKI